MKEKVYDASNNSGDVVEIDFGRIWKAVCKRLWLICVVSVLCAVITVLGTFYLITPQYESSAMFYVNNNSLSVGDTSFSISQGDITAAKSLVDTYIVILKSRACLNDVIDYSGVKLTDAELRKMISASSVNETEVFEVVVTSPDAAEAEELANAIAYILPKRISSIVEGTSANIVDYAIEASKPASPSYPKNAVLGFIFGLLGSIVFVVVRELFDVTICKQEDIERCCKHPILAQVPDMLGPQKQGEYYAYSNRKHASGHSNNGKANVVGKDISFVASEAYKLLRTKLQFSFVDEIDCPIIGVSSALAGEGKSLTAANLAYSLAQLEKRVLLIDCDLRRPSISYKLPVERKPGLSNYLTGHVDVGMVIQNCVLDSENHFDVISSGDTPPNPIELLSSTKMDNVLRDLRNAYDYIIMDLPPVCEVSDALVASKLADGILLVVRQDYCNTVALSSAVSQFEFIETRILGVVVNCVSEHGGKYSKYGKGYYSKYSKYSYASAYAKASKKAQEEHKRKQKRY